MPAMLPVDRLLTSRPELAVFISALRVRPSGFEFDVEVLRRFADASEIDVFQDDPFARPAPSVRRAGSAGSAGAGVRFGVRYPDGRGAAADPGIRPPFGTDRPEPPFVKQSGGRGAPGHWHQRYWVWGLPGSGDIEFVYSWPAEDVAETTFAFDGDRVRAAAAQAVMLWDEPGDGQDGQDGQDGRDGGDGRVAGPAS